MPMARDLHVELLEIADRLDQWGQRAELPEVKEPLDRLEEAAVAIGKSWSGSWLGYHARVYYHDLTPPPPGVHFSQEWGLKDSWPIQDTTGDWQEFGEEDLETGVYQLAQNPNLEHAEEIAEGATKAFGNDKAEVLSLLSTAVAEREDAFLSQIKSDVEKKTILSRAVVIQGLRPSGRLWSRDSLAVSQGLHTPPHFSVLSSVISLRQPPVVCGELAQLVRRAGSHLARQNRNVRRSGEIGTNVFIGHGQSLLWRELKDFIQDRLHLPWDEFNRVPVAGITNIARLSQMLDAAAIAFLVMTGEDEHADGGLRARMNVVHEAGLF